MLRAIPPIGVIIAFVSSFVTLLEKGDAEGAGMMIAVPVIVFVVQFLKEQGMQGKLLDWIAYIIAAVFAGVLLVVTEQVPITNWPINDIPQLIAAILSVATVVGGLTEVFYKAFKKQSPSSFGFTPSRYLYSE